jgi:hypothetical protein
LVDDRYKPITITTNAKDNLNSVLGFKYIIKETETIKDEFHELGILHEGEEILSYETKFQYRYSTVQDERRHFINSTNTSHLEEVYLKIDQLVSVTDFGQTGFVGMKHDLNGVANTICIQDRHYDVSSYQNNFLTDLNSYSKRNFYYSKGILCVGTDNKVSIKMMFDYPKYFYHNNTNKSTDNLLKSRSKINVSYQQAVDRHLYGMRHYNFLTDEQGIYIASLCESMSRDFMIDLEFMFDGTELVDIVCSRVLFKEFEEIEVEKNIRPWFTDTIETV